MNPLHRLSKIIPSLLGAGTQRPTPSTPDTIPLTSDRLYRFEVDALAIDRAVNAALDKENPSREALYRVYHNIVDLRLLSHIRTALVKITSNGWHIVDEHGEPQPQAEKLLQTIWFENLCQYIAEIEFWGHSLVYLTRRSDGLIQEAKLFPRLHVLPERAVLIPSLLNPNQTIAYDQEPFKAHFLEYGQRDDLGTLRFLARYGVVKNYAIRDWARSAEKWGDPLVILQSDSRSIAENQKKEAFLQNLGHSGYAITGVDDKVTLLERQSAGGTHAIYKDLIAFCDEETAIGINGQIGTSYQKAFVGAAQVQERLLNDYNRARLRKLMYAHNDITLPYLASLDGGKSPYALLKNLRFLPDGLTDEPDQPPEAPAAKTTATTAIANPRRKKKAHSLAVNAPAAKHSPYDLSAEADPPIANLDQRIENALHALYKDGKPTRGIDPDLFEITRQSLHQAATQGVMDSQYKTHNSQFIGRLTTDGAVFSAFKNHRQTKEIIALLTDAQGRAVPFHQFQKKALAISQNYNKNWLASEYQTATRRALIGANFKRFQQTAHLYPNLEWLPSTAKEARDTHKPFYHLVLPITDPFWSRYIPGAEWNCRCGLAPSRDPVTPLPDTLPKPPDGLEGNPAIDHSLFGPKHPYYTVSEAEKREIIQYVQRYHDREIKKWAQENVPVDGVIVNNKATISGKLTVLRADVKSVSQKEAVPFMKTYATLITDEKTINTWEFLGRGKVAEGKHTSAEVFHYYKTTYDDTPIYINVKVTEQYGERPYAITRTIDEAHLEKDL